MTEELREAGERVGFKIITLPDRKEGLLARKDLPAAYRVGNYGVNIEDLEHIGCSAIEEALDSEKLIIVDEIGKMELFSARFRDVLVRALDSPQKVLGSIMERSHEFADSIKKRTDVRIFSLSRKDFDRAFHEIQNWLKTV